MNGVWKCGRVRVGLLLLGMGFPCLLTIASCKPTQPWAEAKEPSASRGTESTAHNLASDEALGGHTLKRHVGVSDLQLRQRLTNEPDIAAASTYTDRATAENVISQTLTRNQDRIQLWLERNRHPNLVLDYHGPEPVGRSLRRGERESEPCSRAIVVLRWDPPNRYHVLTSYPECR